MAQELRATAGWGGGGLEGLWMALDQGVTGWFPGLSSGLFPTKTGRTQK
jgi:hypothetical protein